ncbi:hypothetical protein HED51_03050 [Ochrobactrum grignonense]|nr:hypothetical protein [Brucella grignonensis]
MNIVTALKPSLRAALRLTQEFGDLEKVLADILEGKLETLAKIILIASGSENHAKFLHEIATHGAKQIPALQPYFVTFIHGLIADIPAMRDVSPATADAPQHKASNKTPQTPAEYYQRLFQIGTGVLGWTPLDTWNATPTEIVLAYQGRTEFIADILKSVFGTSEDTGPQIDKIDKESLETLIASGRQDPTFDRAGLQALREAL